MKTSFVLVGVLLILSGCAMNYRLEGQTYSGADEFQTAADALYRETRTQLVSTMRVPTPVSKKSLIVGLPTVDAIKGGYIMPNALQVTPAQLMQRDTLSRGARKEYEMFAATVKDVGIYQDVTVTDTSGGHLQPSSTESVLYMFVVPESNAFQWYINGGKTGMQTVNIDRGQPKFLGKATSFVSSVKGYALTDEVALSGVSRAATAPAASVAASVPAPVVTSPNLPPTPDRAPPAPTGTVAKSLTVAPVASDSAPSSRTSRYLFNAERYAKESGCAGAAGIMNLGTATSETFTVACSNSEARSIRCDPVCRELR